jgi:excisionase family DNA binding protein
MTEAVDTSTRALSVAKAAEHLDVSRGHVYGLIASGELPSFDLGHGRAKTRVLVSDLDAFVRSRIRTA